MKDLTEKKGKRKKDDFDDNNDTEHSSGVRKRLKNCKKTKRK